jgi:hypothetical protein
VSAWRAVLGAAPAADVLQDCPSCATPFRARRTRGECPVCGWRVDSAPHRPWLPGADTLDIAVVVTVTAINVILLIVLLLVISRQ